MLLAVSVVFAVTVIVVIAIVCLVYVRSRAPDAVRLSHVKCGKCGAEFDYAWYPGFSLTSIRLVNSRGFNCPACGTFGLFNIVDTQVDPETHRCSVRIGPG